MVKRGHPFRLGHPEATREDTVNGKTVNLGRCEAGFRYCVLFFPIVHEEETLFQLSTAVGNIYHDGVMMKSKRNGLNNQALLAALDLP